MKKKSLKSLIPIFILTFILLLTLVACNKTFSLTLNYDETLGDIKIVSGVENGKFTGGEEIVVEATAKKGYRVSSFSVNGEEITPHGNSYTFKLKKNGTVNVQFAEAVGEFNITTDYDETLGSVSLSSPSAGDKYYNGESVTATVTPKSGRYISSVSLNGNTLTVQNNSVTFNISGDSVLSVTFGSLEAKYTATATFTSLLGDVKLSAPALGGNKYYDGEKITVTVTPKERFRVASLKLNGVNQEEYISGNFDFNITEDTVIAVDFVNENVGVHLDYAESRGSVTLSPVLPAGKQYNKGDDVTVTVKAFDNFRIGRVTLNNKTVELDGNGSFAFKVTDSMNVKVEFRGKDLDGSVYDIASLANGVKFSGEYAYVSPNETLNFISETVFATDGYISQYEADKESGTVAYDLIFKRSDKTPKFISRVYLDISNSVKEEESTDLYNDYSNPFATLNPTDFELDGIEDGYDVYALKSLEKARQVASRITGWNESMKSFKIYFKNGKPEKAVFVTAEIDRYDDTKYVSTYRYNIEDVGTAKVKKIEPYAHVANHDRLTAALAKASGKTEYKVRHYSHEYNYDSEDLDYNKYVTANVIYQDFDSDRYGYYFGSFDGSDTLTYPFSVLNGEITLQDPVSVSDFNSLKPSFDWNGIAVELFRAVDNNTFELQNAKTFAGRIFSKFAIGTDETKYFSTAYSLKIILSDGGDILKVIAETNCYGLNEIITLTFDFDSQINLNLDFDEAKKESVLDPFIGKYADENGNTATVDRYGFVINGSKATVQSYDKSTSTFTTSWQNTTLYIGKFSSRQLLVYDDSLIYWILDPVNNPQVTVPDAYLGHWFIANSELGSAVQEYYDIDFDFVIQKHAAWFNGKAAQIISYTSSEGLILSCDDMTFAITVAKLEDGNVLDVIVVKGDLVIQVVPDYIDGNVGVEIPDNYVGSFINKDGGIRRIDVTYTSVTVFGESYDITSFDVNTGLTVTLNGTSHVLKVQDGKMTVDGGSDEFTPYNIIPANYVGNWNAMVTFEDSTQIPYRLEITDISIRYIEYNEDGSIKLDQSFDSNALALDDYGYHLNVTGRTHVVYVLYGKFGAGLPTLIAYDDDNFLVLYKKQSEFDTDIKLPDYIDGYYAGKDKTDTLMTIAISSSDTTVYMTIGNSTEVQAKITEFEDGVYMLIEVNGTEYYLFFNEGSEVSFRLCNGEGDEIATLEKV